MPYGAINTSKGKVPAFIASSFMPIWQN